MTRILIADDHKILRESLMLLLTQEENLEVVGEAADGREAIEAVLRLQPDIAILDISLPRLSGIEAAARLKQELPDLKVVILTMHKTEDYIRKAFQAGVDAYLLKENAFEELRHAIDVVIGGGKYISEKIAPTIISGFIDSARTLSCEAVTPREREVLQLLAEGYSNKEVAKILNLSIKTVDTHRTSIMRKLGLHSISELVLYAVRNHIIEP